MFDLTNPLTDGIVNATYSSPYTSTAYLPSSSFLFNIPTSIDDQQQFSSYPNPTHDLM